MGVNLSWGNTIKAFENRIKKRVLVMEKDIQNLVNDTAEQILIAAKKHTPKDTGNLKNAWTLLGRGRGHKRKVTISNNLNYAGIIEYGSNKKAPARMLTQGVASGRRFMRRRIRQIKRKI